MIKKSYPYNIKVFDMKYRFMILFSAVSGFIFVALGAFGAHILRSLLTVQEQTWLHTGLQYQAIHTLSILGVVALGQGKIHFGFYWSTLLWALGIVLFSGSLYGLALSSLKVWAYVTPIGGSCFLLGWGSLFLGAIRMRKRVRFDG